MLLKIYQNPGFVLHHKKWNLCTWQLWWIKLQKPISVNNFCAASCLTFDRRRRETWSNANLSARRWHNRLRYFTSRGPLCFFRGGYVFSLTQRRPTPVLLHLDTFAFFATTLTTCVFVFKLIQINRSASVSPLRFIYSLGRFYFMMSMRATNVRAAYVYMKLLFDQQSRTGRRVVCTSKDFRFIMCALVYYNVRWPSVKMAPNAL